MYKFQYSSFEQIIDFQKTPKRSNFKDRVETNEKNSFQSLSTLEKETNFVSQIK